MDYAPLIWNTSGIEGIPKPSVLVHDNDELVSLEINVPFLKEATWKRNNLSYRMFEYNFGDESLWYEIPVPPILEDIKPSRRGNVLTFEKPVIEVEVGEETDV